MPEAVIVSTARSPIGRAVKGSLATMRPDDLAAQMVRAALEKLPSLDPRDVDDLIMGCGQPAGEAGYNIARAVAVELGYGGNIGKRLKRADKLGAAAAIILGEDELARGEAALRDLDSGEQTAVPLAELEERLARFR